MNATHPLLHQAKIATGPFPAQRLWLALEDGRIMAYRLPPQNSACDDLLPSLAHAALNDPSGETTEASLPGGGRAAYLYAAPAEPEDADFGEAIDREILALLKSLNGIRVFDTVRNYNRLISLDIDRRRNRMQAIAQYPAVLSHVFLTPHQDYDLQGGSRHRWRMHDEELIAAVDNGQSLLPLLAERSGVTKSVFRAPVMQSNWPDLGLARPHVLKLLDGIPAHRRPASTEELILARPVLAWLNWNQLQAPSVLQAVGAEFFREGIAPAMARYDRKYSHHALTDTRDFVSTLHRFLGERESALTTIDHDSERQAGDPVLTAWLMKHGLWALLAASSRWHDGMREHQGNSSHDPIGWPIVLGKCRIGAWEAIELENAAALEIEGRQMRHCVATRWQVCARDGARIFSLHQAHQAGGDGERATAQFNLLPGKAGALRYALYELRGPENDDPTRACRRIARHLESMLNRPERQFAIAQAIAAAQQARLPRPVRVWLDEASERMALALPE